MTMEAGTQTTKSALDRHNIMKQELLEDFNLKYTQIIRLVASMPLAHTMRMNGFARADEFYFWIREAINQIQFIQPEQVPPPVETPPEAPPAPAPEEATEKVAEPAPLE